MDVLELVEPIEPNGPTKTTDSHFFFAALCAPMTHLVRPWQSQTGYARRCQACLKTRCTMAAAQCHSPGAQCATGHAIGRGCTMDYTRPSQRPTPWARATATPYWPTNKIELANYWQNANEDGRSGLGMPPPPAAGARRWWTHSGGVAGASPAAHPHEPPRLFLEQVEVTGGSPGPGPLRPPRPPLLGNWHRSAGPSAPKAP